MNSNKLETRLGVCSWSVHPKTPGDLVDQLAQLKLKKVQLALGPLVLQPGVWGDVGRQLADAGIAIASGMLGCVGEDYSTIASIRRTGGVLPDETWPATLENMKKAAPITKTLGLTLVTLHAGFIPHDANDSKFAIVVDRITTIADIFKSQGIEIALETGQESANDLNGFLIALGRKDVGVNFDPGNMILYSSGDPVRSVKLLLPQVKQVHLKDATAGPDSETWGKEVPVGAGQVDWPAFFSALKHGNYAGDYIIEREAGDQRIPDILQAQKFLYETYEELEH